MAFNHLDTDNPESLVKITPVTKTDTNGTISHGVEMFVPLSEFTGQLPAASLTTGGTVKQGAFVAAAAVPFADLTAAANSFNALRTSLINAGVIAAS
jgi:hypothetical protein